MNNLEQKVHSLGDELHAFPAAEAERALLHLLATVAQWIGADKAHWVAMARFPALKSQPDPLQGWRSCAYRSLHPYTKAELKILQEIRRKRAAGTIKPAETTPLLLAQAGTYRTRRLHDGLVTMNTFAQSQHYRLHYERMGIVDRLWSFVPVSPHTEACFFFDLVSTEKRFTHHEVEIVATVLRGMHHLCRSIFLCYGILVARKPLTRTQRAVTQLLLTEKSEHEIANALGQSYATVHKHIETIYRAFGVKSRAALMALWLARS